MADITLRDYLAKLDSLLNSGASSEVIHHCRHILQYFPKNAETYRYLGRALIENKSWREADEVLRRVLSVYPDDFFAHAGLSEVSLAEKRPDDAIWFMERAFEQQPNNEVILDTLRELYRKHRRVEHAKVQLTAGAVAQQYVRNGLFAQAITALQQALAQTSDRVDLKLLLARTYWDAGQKVDAAETAVAVLQTLPDCLQANRILAELWLGESRPSDAQRYISNIQSVEPYLALELAKGQKVPDNAYKLEELDYRRLAEREIVTRSPDWLQAVDQAADADSASDDTSDWMSSLRSRGAVEEEELPTFGDENLSSSTPDDWFSKLADTGEDAPETLPPEPRKRTGLTGLLSAIDVPEPTPIPEPELSFENLFDEPEIDTAPTGDVDDLFSDDLFSDEDATPEPGEIPAPSAVTDADPLAWMRGSDIEMSDEPRTAADLDLFGADDDNLALQNSEAAEDPLAWLKSSGGEDIINPVEQSRLEWSATAQFATAPKADSDPMAWLDEQDDLVPENKPQPAAQEADPLDWLADESLLDEALNLEALTTNDTSEHRVSAQVDIPATAERPDRQDEMADEKDNAFDWMNDDSSKADAGNDDFTWASQEPAASDDEVPDLFASFESSGDAQPAGDALDWMSELDDAGQQAASSADEDMPDWLTNMQPEEARSAPAASLPDVGQDDDAGFEWMSEVPAADDAPVEPAGDVPDWLSQMEPETPAAQSSAAPVEDDGFEWMSEVPNADDAPAEPAADVPNWLSQMEPEAHAEPEPAADVPDWLSQMEPETQAAQSSTPAPADEAEFEWISENAPTDDDLTAEPAGDVPDWLSQMEPAQAEVEPEPAADVPDWLSQMEPAQAEIEPEPAADVPDWLSQMEPETPQPVMQSEAAPVENDEFEWMSEAAPTDDDLIAEPTADAPSWLSELQPDEPETEQPEWLSESAPTDDDLIAEPTADAPSWLSELQPDEPETEQPVMQNEAAAMFDDDQPEWLSESAPTDDDLIAEPTADAPSWLSELQPDEPETEQPVMQADAAAMFDDDQPEWLSESAPAEDDLTAEPAADVPSWLSEMQPEEPETEQPVMQSEAAPVEDEGFDWGGDSGEPMQPVGNEVPEWLTTLQTHETAAVSAAEAEPVSEFGDEYVEPRGAVPDWLAELQQEAPVPAESAVIDEAPIPWDNEPVEEEEPAAEASTPDWLEEVKSSRSETPVEDEETETSSEFEWIGDITTTETQSEPVLTSESTFDDFDDDDDLLSAEDMPVPVLAGESGGNAPDWLNAMVPGLDVDYDAPEDEQIEQEFLPGSENRVIPIFQGASQPARNREFEWLVDMVDEETQQMKAEPGKPRRGRFVFSRLPLWLRQPTEQSSAKQAVGEDDWSDDDLPPWLQ